MRQEVMHESNEKKMVCALNQCSGCMLCVDKCPVKAISIEDTMDAYNAVIDSQRCIECNLCHKNCHVNNPAKKMKPIKWFQGWSKNEKIRQTSSSGGFAAEISKEFVRSGGVVCSCLFKNGVFGFEFARNANEIRKFSGSKYIKSNPSGIYESIFELLKGGTKVLYIALPCQVSALKRYLDNRFDDNLYTIDLICHGTSSPKVLNSFLNTTGVKLLKVDSISFRNNNLYSISRNGEPCCIEGTSDRYSLAFLNTLIYTENCYNCQYACKERVSDITIGDSWGSNLPVIEQKKGISLALCQTEKGVDLLKRSMVHLEDVDLNDAISHNHQLEKPSQRNKARRGFMDKLKKGRKFSILVFQALPSYCIKQQVKGILIKLKLMK